MINVAFIVNGDSDSAMGRRANAFAASLANRYNIRIAYRGSRKILSLIRFVFFLIRIRPRVCYVFDIAYSGLLAAVFHKWLTGNSLIVDTGDAIYELARSTGNRGRLGLWLTRWLENKAFRAADHIVVRGTLHQRLLAEKGITAEIIHDGVETDAFAPATVDGLRKQYGLSGSLTVGVLGSSVWSEKLQMCYGWELVEALRFLKDAPVKGIMIGDGSGISRLKERCRDYGIEDRMVFLGHVSYNDLPVHVNLIDVCLSTQSNDVVGRVRTTGKLPLYLAAGRYILASNVGEASLILDEEMLVDYEGVKDQQYPRKLAERIANILERPETLKQAAVKHVALAKEHFDYSILSTRMQQCLDKTLTERGDNR